MDPSLTQALINGIYVLSGYIILNSMYQVVALFGQVQTVVQAQEQTKLLKEALSKTAKTPDEVSGWVGKPPTGIQ
jgi:hypothetical protein